jgi:hypothetical protein
MKVSIVGGGSGTSFCTEHETDTTFTTTSDDEVRTFGFDSKGGGGCFLWASWSKFRVTVKDPSGTEVGSGTMWFGQEGPPFPYYLRCPANGWNGIVCWDRNEATDVEIERVYSHTPPRADRAPDHATTSFAALRAGISPFDAGAAAGPQIVRCVGTADYCGATVLIGGGVENRDIDVEFPAKRLKPIGVWAVPAKSAAGFEITHAALGPGIHYHFRLSALTGNPATSRIVLLFAEGSPVPATPLPRGGRKSARVIFDVGAGKQVSIIGGGAGTSNCTADETNDTFTTVTGTDEGRWYGMDIRGSGSCGTERSWSRFKIRIESHGRLVGAGTLWLGDTGAASVSTYETKCDQGPWVGASCKKVEGDEPSEIRITG